MTTIRTKARVASFYTISLPITMLKQLSRADGVAAHRKLDGIFASREITNRFPSREEAERIRAELIDFGLDVRTYVAETMDV